MRENVEMPKQTLNFRKLWFEKLLSSFQPLSSEYVQQMAQCAVRGWLVSNTQTVFMLAKKFNEWKFTIGAIDVQEKCMK